MPLPSDTLFPSELLLPAEEFSTGMGVPTITVQVAWGSNPGDASYTWQTIHTGSTGDVRAIGYQRGRQNEMNRSETGLGHVLLRDEASDYDPDNPDSPWYPNVKPMRPIRATALLSGATYPLFQHYIERIPRTQRIGNSYTERELTTVDGFAWLAQAGLATKVYTEQLSGARVGVVLDDAGWSSTLRDIDAGQSMIVGVTFDPDVDYAALTYLLEIADSENGILFIDAQGRVSFVQRHALISTPYTVSQATFRDANSGGGGFQFVEATPSYDLDHVANDWSGTRDGGVTQTASDATSRTTYGKRSQQVVSLATTDNEVASQVQWKLAQFKDPLNRLASITVMPGNNSSAWAACLGLEVGSRVTVVETPPGFAAPRSAPYLIQHLAVEIPAGPIHQARFRYSLWPADVVSWFILDDAAFGLLDTNQLAY